MRSRSLALLLLAAGTSLAAAEWTWTWTPAAGDPAPTATVTTFKYGKDWAYAIEIDDGPKWVRSFAVPFLAGHHFTDAPPGVAGGRPMPFVGSVAAIGAAVGNNSANVDWDDLKALLDAGWGVMNHSYDHRGRSWGDPSGQMSDAEIVEDAFWSQAVFVANLPGGRTPTAAVYANGYTDYNRNNALADVGIGIGTRVGGSSPRDVTSPQVKWHDFTRSYLDDGVWTNASNQGDPMADFPDPDKNGPAVNSLVIDFTHGIDQDAGSANQKRWQARLSNIEKRWGASGSDTLWCAPTGDVADYVHAAKAATVKATPGKLTVSVPDNLPGSALTLRLTGIGAKAKLTAPDGGALYRQGDAVILTTPVIGKRGAAPPVPHLKKIYEGPAVSVDFAQPEAVAGVTLGVFGCPKAPATYRLAVRTADGDKPFAERTLEPKWIVGGHLCPIVPNRPAIAGTGIAVEPVPELKTMTVWAINDGK